MKCHLLLLGCDVASFGVNQPKPDDADITELVWNDPILGVYRKLIFNKAGTKLQGGILVSNASDYSTLHKLAVGSGDQEPLDGNPALLLPPLLARSGAATESEQVSDDPNTQICSCNNVSRGTIVQAIKDLCVEGATLPILKKCTKAGTGCGGCELQVKSILAEELQKLGGKMSNRLYKHFDMSCLKVMALVRVDPDPTSVDSFDKVLAKHGHVDGCEICKPTVVSILASLMNKVIINDGRNLLQDTNDQAMANMQQGGSYSVVPCVPGRELTPDQLIALGVTAKKFNLYAKITGGQCIDLFGAAKHKLPDYGKIWERPALNPAMCMARHFVLSNHVLD